jgi:hypothetical protein
MTERKYNAVIGLLFAWVLWMESNENWKPLHAFNTQAECDANIGHLGERYTFRGYRVEGSRESLSIRGSKTATLRCFSSDLDPRPRR